MPGTDPTAFDDLSLLRRQAASQRGFYRALAAGAPGSRLVEPVPGVQATVVPARPWFSIFNSVLYTDVDGLAAVLPELPAVYEAAEVQAWTVWVPPGDARGAAAMEAAGNVLDSSPMLMAAPMEELDLEPQPTWALEVEPDTFYEHPIAVARRAARSPDGDR